MLKAMRTGSQSMIIKLVLFGLLLMAMLGLAVMDVQGMFSRGLKSTVVASLGREKISVPEFERILEGNLRQQNIPLSEAIKAGIPQRVLGAEVDGRLFFRESHDLGFSVDDATASKSIKVLLKQFVDQAHVTEKDALHRILTNMGVSERQFVTGVKSEIATNTMMDLLKAGTYVPEQLVNDALTYKNEARQARYFKISVNDAIKDPDEKTLKDYYATISKQFMEPERRTFSVALLDKKALGVEDAKTSDADLKKYYDDHKNEFIVPETRTIEQAVAKDEKSAQAIYAAVKKSSSLQQAAQKEKATFIKEQSLTEKDIAVELSAAAFKDKTTGVLEPIQSPLGWHVLQIKKISPETTKSFDSAKPEIAKIVAQDQGGEALYQKASDIDDMIAGGKTLADVAKELSIKTTTFSDVDPTGLDRNHKKISTTLPMIDKIIAQAFTLDKNEASQLIETPTGEFLLVETLDITPTQEQAFESVRSDVLKNWKERAKSNLIEEKAADISARLKKGESFDSLAKEMKKTPTTTALIKRRAVAEKADFDQNAVAALFALQKIGDSASTISADEIVVLTLSNRQIDGSQSQSKEDVAAVQAILSRALQADIQDQYRTSLIKKHDVTINDDLMNETYNPNAVDETAAAE